MTDSRTSLPPYPPVDLLVVQTSFPRDWHYVKPHHATRLLRNLSLSDAPHETTEALRQLAQTRGRPLKHPVSVSEVPAPLVQALLHTQPTTRIPVTLQHMPNLQAMQSHLELPLFRQIYSDGPIVASDTDRIYSAAATFADEMDGGAEKKLVVLVKCVGADADLGQARALMSLAGQSSVAPIEYKGGSDPYRYFHEGAVGTRAWNKNINCLQGLTCSFSQGMYALSFISYV